MAKKTNNGAATGTTKRTTPKLADATGEQVDLSELGLIDKFSEGRSAYEKEIDALIAETERAENPLTVGRKYADVRALNSLKKRADAKKVRLQILTLPNNGGFVVRLDPDQTPKERRKKKGQTPTPEQSTAEVPASTTV